MRERILKRIPPIREKVSDFSRVFSMKRLFLVYTLPLLLFVALLSVFDVFERPDLFFLDRAFQLRGIREPSEKVVVVAISKEDFERGAPRWPWPRSMMARLVDQVAVHKPAVIAVDILYTERTNTEAVITQREFADIQPFLYQVFSGERTEVRTPEGTRTIGPGTAAFDHIASGMSSAEIQDRELADAVQRAVDSGIAVVLAADAVFDGRAIGLIEPYDDLNEASGESIGLVGVRTDADGVLRRYPAYWQDKEGRFVYGLALAAVAKDLGVSLPEAPLDNGDLLIGADTLVKVNNGRFLVNFQGPPGTYPTFTARDVLRAEEDFSSRLRDKIVFLGVTDPSVEDIFSTPFTSGELMPGVEFHATAADTLLTGSFITPSPRYQEFLMIVALGLAAVALGRFVRPSFGLTGILAVLGGVIGIWIGAFAGAHQVLPISSSLVIVFLGYGSAITDRVSVEQLEKQQARSMFSRYLHPGIVKKILDNPAVSQLGGERAEVTVLFSDIRGFTSLSEWLPPEEVVSLLNHYLTVMSEVVFQHEGTVDKFEGDLIMAFFGAPLPQSDHAERAILTALGMREKLATLQDEWRERTQADLRIGIGIHTGQVFVGNIGSPRKMDYTIIGDTVNTASHLQDLTKEYDTPILVSGQTYSRVKHMARFRTLGTVPVRGRQQPVDLYEMQGVKEGQNAGRTSGALLPS